MGEVLQSKQLATKTFPATKREDIEEVLNYRRAMRQAVDLLRTLPLCNRVVKGTTRKRSFREFAGLTNLPGRFRTIQNFIGRPGTQIENAKIYPNCSGSA